LTGSSARNIDVSCSTCVCNYFNAKLQIGQCLFSSRSLHCANIWCVAMASNMLVYTGWAYAAGTATCVLCKLGKALWTGDSEQVHREVSCVGQSVANTALSGLLTFPVIAMLSKDRSAIQLLRTQSACFGLLLPYHYYQSIHFASKNDSKSESECNSEDNDVKDDTDFAWTIILLWLFPVLYIIDKTSSKRRNKKKSQQ